MKFLYWNLHRNPKILDCLVALIKDQQPDIAIFSEWDLKKSSVLTEINSFSQPKFSLVFSQIPEPVILTKYPKDTIEKSMDMVTGCICRIKPVVAQSFLLFSLHLPSKLHKDDIDQTLNAQRVSRMIDSEEEREGHRRSIVVGDFNMNPFESGMVAGDCFHSVMDKQIVNKESRAVSGEERFFFYNPMWSRFGDQTPGPSGTYYYNSGGQVNHYWNMFDQVLIRPDLLEYFKSESVEIIEKAGAYNLLKPSGIPDNNISDHLPIAFEMNVQ